jgi:hypothetical protein
MPFAKTKSLEKRSPGAFETYRATTASAISAGELVRVTGTSDGGAYYIVQKAQTGQAGQIMVATIDSNSDGYLLVAKSDTLSLDTSAASLGDTVYLSGTAGDVTLTPTDTPIGWVTAVDTDGTVLIEPSSSVSSTGEWIDITSEKHANWNGLSSEVFYRVSNGRVELRGAVDSLSARNYPQDVFSSWPPAALAPPNALLGHVQPAISYLSGTPSTAAVSVTTQISLESAEAGVTQLDYISLDGVSWPLG